MPWSVCVFGVLLASVVVPATAVALLAELDRSGVSYSYHVRERRHRGRLVHLAWPPEMRLFEKART